MITQMAGRDILFCVYFLIAQTLMSILVRATSKKGFLKYAKRSRFYCTPRDWSPGPAGHKYNKIFQKLETKPFLLPHGDIRRPHCLSGAQGSPTYAAHRLSDRVLRIMTSSLFVRHEKHSRPSGRGSRRFHHACLFPTEMIRRSGVL